MALERGYSPYSERRCSQVKAGIERLAADHAAAYFAVFQPALSGGLRTTAKSLAYGILLYHLAVPLT